jgi:ribosomal protein S18
MAELNFPTAAAAGIKPAPQMSLMDMLNMARGVQFYQQSQQMNPIELQKAQAELSKYQAMSPLDIEKATAETKVATQTAPTRIEAQRFATETAGVGTESAKMKFANEQSAAISNRLTGLINNPLVIASQESPQTVNKDQLAGTLKKYAEEQAKALGIPKEQADKLIEPYLEQATTNTAGLRQFLKEKLLTTLDQSARLGAIEPKGLGVTTGVGGYTVQTGQFGTQQPGQILPGTAYESQIPTGTAITLGEGNPYGLPVGTQILKPPVSQTPQNAGPTIGALAPQVASTIAANTAVANEDWKQTTAAALTAPQRIATFQNIKKLAPESFTAVGGEKKALASGIANALGITAYEAENTATQELIKNTKLLAIAGGNTDAARQLAEAANPNNKMNVPAIKNIADMMIGVEKMNLARQKYLASARDNPSTYQQKMQEFIPFMDSRLYQEMTAEDVKKLKSSMSANEQAEISAKIKKARQLGIL